ncbi:MAG: hypothetical protein ACKON9_21820, partial [Planctomycetaceae bacterium]
MLLRFDQLHRLSGYCSEPFFTEVSGTIPQHHTKGKIHAHFQFKPKKLLGIDQVVPAPRLRT